MDEPSIRAEMHKFATERLDRSEVVERDALVYHVLDARGSIEGEDAAFYRVHTFHDLQRIAKSVVGKYDTKDTTDSELLFPGFKHLSRAYPMKREGKIAIVPVDLCTDDELKARAAQLDEMAKGCTQHALEIREYVLARARVAA